MKTRELPPPVDRTLGDTHLMLTRDGTDGFLHYGTTHAKCGARPTGTMGIKLTTSMHWVDCPACC